MASVENSSCETQLLTLVDELLHGVAKGKQYDLVIIDFSKVFYVIPYKHFLEKLDHSSSRLSSTTC